MKRYRKEATLIVVACAVAVAGLLQLFHDNAYACTDPQLTCGQVCVCGCDGSSLQATESSSSAIPNCCGNGGTNASNPYVQCRTDACLPTYDTYCQAYCCHVAW